MEIHKFKVGEKVIYDGLIATIESKDVYAIGGNTCYGLIADEDNELSCTADENECVLYEGQDIDQSDKLNEAYFESLRIAHLVNSVTDKFFIKSITKK